MRDFVTSPKADKFFKKIKEKPLREKFNATINAVRENPYIGERKTGNLKDIFCKDIYHAGVNYELAYKVVESDGELIVIILAGVRENFYDDLERYVKELDF